MRAIRNFVTSEVVSPAFVRRLVAEHGSESVAEAFMLRGQPLALAVEFLLRRHKGHFYRKRYPSMWIEQEGARDRTRKTNGHAYAKRTDLDAFGHSAEMRNNPWFHCRERF